MRMFVKFSGFIYDREDFNFINFELFCSTTCVLIVLNDGNEWALYPGQHAVRLSNTVYPHQTMSWRNIKDLDSSNSYQDCKNYLR